MATMNVTTARKKVIQPRSSTAIRCYRAMGCPSDAVGVCIDGDQLYELLGGSAVAILRTAI
jgi:hypothetical protein